MEKVRFGIIGVGNMGCSHAKTFLKGEVQNGVLTAICDLKQEKIDKVLGLDYEGAKNLATFSDYKEMLKSGLCDVVIVAVPHYDHPRMTIDVLDAGLNVICEKPAGVYTKQVKEMNEVAAKSDKLFAMMFNQRTNCVYRKMREMVQNGEIGEIKRVNWIITTWYRSQSYYNSGGWRATWKGEGGGVLFNQCPHQLDLLQWVIGMMPKQIHSFCHFGKWHDIEVEDDVTAYVEYANGATGLFVTTTGDAPGSNRFEITLEKGKMIAEGNSLTIWKSDISEPEFSKTNTAPFGIPKYQQTTIELQGEIPQHRGVMNAFAAAILHGTPLVANGIEGINGLSISNAMHLSAWTDKTIDIETLDHELYYEELMKRVATSRRKTNVTQAVTADMGDTFGS